jgi:CheY-like chemotaxis protein
MGVSAAGFALAVSATGAALGLALALAPLVRNPGEPLFLLAIVTTAVISGLVPGLVALVLSVAALNWWFFPPERAFGLTNTTDLVRQLLFAIAGLLMAVLAGRARALHFWAEGRAGEAEFQLEAAEGRLARVRRRGSGRSSAPREPAAEATAGESKVDETVLIVDADAGTRRLASRAVEAAGFRWVSACDGVEALELLDRYDVPFALVVTDLGLPDIPGPELMRRIAERRPGLPVLYTAARPDSAASPAPAAGEYSVLEKPFTPDELVRRTRDVLAGAERERGSSE